MTRDELNAFVNEELNPCDNGPGCCGGSAIVCSNGRDFKCGLDDPDKDFSISDGAWGLYNKPDNDKKPKIVKSCLNCALNGCVSYCHSCSRRKDSSCKDFWTPLKRAIKKE